MQNSLTGCFKKNFLISKNDKIIYEGPMHGNGLSAAILSWSLQIWFMQIMWPIEYHPALQDLLRISLLNFCGFSKDQWK